MSATWRRLRWLLLGVVIGVAGMHVANALVIASMPPELRYRGVQPAPAEPPRPVLDLTPTAPLTFDYRHGWKDGVVLAPLPNTRSTIVPAPHTGPGGTPQRLQLTDHTVPEPAALALLLGPLAWLIWRSAA